MSTEVVIVMPGGIYGPNDTSTLGRLMLDAAHGKPTLAPKSLKLMEAHVDDVADGHLRAMQLGRAGSPTSSRESRRMPTRWWPRSRR